MKRIFLAIGIISAALTSCKSSQHADLGEGLFADINTTKGEIIVKLEAEKTPVTVANFVSLAEGNNPFVTDSLKGKKYYDGLIFHRVMKDFMIQGGDPTGTGRGYPGYKFKDEFNDSLNHNKPGVLSMANSGPPKTNGSQFFITQKETPWLNGVHTVFGEVVEGMNVVDTIANVKTSKEPMTKDRPEVDVVMNTVKIIRNGKAAKKFDAVKIMTDYFAEEQANEAKMAQIRSEFVNELNEQKAQAEELPSGLRILKITEGTGEKPKLGQKVNVFYAGYLPDGTLFDSNYEEVAKNFGRFDQRRKDMGGYEATPMDYTLESGLVAGFREGLLTMRVGDKYRLFIPPHLGWGPQGSGPIPPNSDTIFDVEITGITE
jgi:cyclophilin family peptidyl-prolyl cis-trans isomerase